MPVSVPTVTQHWFKVWLVGMFWGYELYDESGREIFDLSTAVK